jgi:hypothetical protein
VSEQIKATESSQSGHWQNVAVPWAFVEISPDSQVTSGTMKLAGDVVTYGDTVIVMLAGDSSVPPPRPVAPPPMPE